MRFLWLFNNNNHHILNTRYLESIQMKNKSEIG
jgi:hypothetical protein